jgi:hypothetical protein
MTTCARLLTGCNRAENERCTALRSYYAFESFHCLPGPEGAHDNGGLEGEVSRCRRCQFILMPNVGSVEEPNELVAAGDRLDDLCHIDGWRLSGTRWGRPAASRRSRCKPICRFPGTE